MLRTQRTSLGKILAENDSRNSVERVATLNERKLNTLNVVEQYQRDQNTLALNHYPAEKKRILSKQKFNYNWIDSDMQDSYESQGVIYFKRNKSFLAHLLPNKQ